MAQRDREVYKNKLSSLIKRTVMGIIFDNVKDSDLKKISIKHIKMSKDLKIAYLFIETYDKDLKIEDIVERLNGNSTFIHLKLGKALKLKNIPRLIFKQDTSTDYFFHIEEVINKIEKEKPDEKDIKK